VQVVGDTSIASLHPSVGGRSFAATFKPLHLRFRLKMSSKTVSSTSSHILSPSVTLFAAAKTKDLTHLVTPYKNEAVIRLRNSTVSLVTLTVITYLLPVPSLWTALSIVRRSQDRGFLWCLCAAGTPRCVSLAWYSCNANASELALSALLALNLVQAVFALKYPRKPLPPLPTSPAKGLVTPQSQKKRRTILAPGVRFFPFPCILIVSY